MSKILRILVLMLSMGAVIQVANVFAKDSGSASAIESMRLKRLIELKHQLDLKASGQNEDYNPAVFIDFPNVVSEADLVNEFAKQSQALIDALENEGKLDKPTLKEEVASTNHEPGV